MKPLLFVLISGVLCWGLARDMQREHDDEVLSAGGAVDERVVGAIRQAISQRKLLAVIYDGGERIVEPHMLALNEQEQAVLSAWFVHGVSRNGGGPGWRSYLLSRITAAYVQDETFLGTRPGYDPSGGRKFHGVISRL